MWRLTVHGCAVVLSTLGMCSPALGMEVELFSTSPGATVLEGMMKRVGRTLESGKRPVLISLTNEFKSEVFHGSGSLLQSSSQFPIKVNLSLATRPNVTERKITLDREIKVSATRTLPLRMSPSVEVAVKHSGDVGQVLVLYSVSF